jgi:cell division FtsZ-interacting protein ZapD
MAPKLYTQLDTERLLKNFEKHFNEMAGALEKQRQALKTIVDVCASQQDMIDKLHSRLKVVEEAQLEAQQARHENDERSDERP